MILSEEQYLLTFGEETGLRNALEGAGPSSDAPGGEAGLRLLRPEVP